MSETKLNKRKSEDNIIYNETYKFQKSDTALVEQKQQPVRVVSSSSCGPSRSHSFWYPSPSSAHVKESSLKVHNPISFDRKKKNYERILKSYNVIIKNPIYYDKHFQISAKTIKSRTEWLVICTNDIWSCSCPDHKHRKVTCKHIYAAMRYIFNLTEDELPRSPREEEAMLVEKDKVARFKETTKEWVELNCDDCGKKEGLEFATDDGTHCMAVLLCALCSVGPKKLSQRYGDLDEFFCNPSCQECGEEDGLLRPKDAKGTESVRCAECQESEEDEDFDWDEAIRQTDEAVAASVGS